MWQWIIDNSILLLVISVAIIILGLVSSGLVRFVFKKEIPKKKPKESKNFASIFFWVVETLAWITLFISLIATIFNQEGEAELITVEDIETWLVEHGLPIFAMLVIGFVIWVGLNKFLPPVITKMLYREKQGESLQGTKKRTNTLINVFLGIAKVILVIVVLFMILSELSVEVGPIIAGLGIVGVAVGFGAQYLVRDLIAGVFVIIENQYRVGDVASIAGVTALVEDINLRKTVLRDLDGVVHHVPNGEIKVASNYTRHFSRANLDISVSYNTDLEFAMKVINRVGITMANDPKWKDHIITPPQALRVQNLGDSGIDIRVLGDCKPMQQWAVMGELRLRLKKEFDKEGIEIPWPHVKLYFGEPNAAGLKECKQCSHRNLPDSKFCANCGASLKQ